MPTTPDNDEERQARVDQLVKQLEELKRHQEAEQKTVEQIANELAALREQQKQSRNEPPEE